VRFSTIGCTLAAGSAVVFAAVLSCAPEPEIVTSKIRFDGTTYEFDSDISCDRQHDGGLLINAPAFNGRPGGPVPAGRGKKLIRLLLLEEPRIIVETAGFRFNEIHGFTEAGDDMWGTKVDDVYTVNGRVRDDSGPQWHQFEITVTCPYIRPPRFMTSTPRPPRMPPP